MMKKADEKRKIIKSAEHLIDMKINSNMKGPGLEISMEMGAKGKARQIKVSDTDAIVEMDLVMTLFGVESRTVSYYADGWIYQDDNGRKTKANIGLDEAMEMTNFTPDFDIKKENIKNIEISKIVSGTRYIVDFDPKSIDELSSLFDDAMIGDLRDNTDVEFSVPMIRLDIFVDNDFVVKSEAMTIVMKAGDEDGNLVEIRFATKLELVAYNHIDRINLPDDLDQYKSLSPDLPSYAT
jgi:hypothetical protein